MHTEGEYLRSLAVAEYDFDTGGLTIGASQ